MVQISVGIRTKYEGSSIGGEIPIGFPGQSMDPPLEVKSNKTEDYNWFSLWLVL